MIASSLRSLFSGQRSELQGPADRRADLRRKVLLRADIFPILGYAEIAVENVSRSGLAAETNAMLQVGQPLLFSIDGNSFHMGTVRWTRGRRFGLNLDDALGIFGLANETDHGFLGEHRPRATRHQVDVIGRIAIGSQCYESRVRDVSQSGLRLETTAPLAERQQVIVRLKDRPLILANVQWCRGGLVGVKTVERMTTLRLAYAYE
jgi:hypothetical protein